MLAFFFVALCRSFDDKNDTENEGDDKKELNKWDGSNEDVIILVYMKV